MFSSLIAFLFFFIVHQPLDFTPGCLCTQQDKDFDGQRYAEHISHCHRNVSDTTKNLVASRYHVNRGDYKMYEFDHLIPLAIGGSNNGCNIWPQPLGEAHKKDVVEMHSYELLKHGKINQKQAITMVIGWNR